jgi:putative ABC transport system ATP-binding protein
MNHDTSPQSAPLLRLENLFKHYDEGGQQRVVLKNTTVSFAPGEFTAILGKSGSGKTTLLNLVSGIDRADSGRVWFNGTDLTALDDRQRTLFRRQNIGFIFQ